MNYIFTLILILTLTGGLYGCGYEPNEADQLTNALQSIEENDFRVATIQLKNVLRKNPDNREARRILGELQFQKGSLEPAAKELLRARELGEPDSNVLPLLSRTYLALGKYDDLENLSLEKLEQDGDIAILLAIQGRGRLAQGDITGATRLIDSALELDPKSTDAHIAKAKLLVANRKLDSARAEADFVLAKEPDNGEGWSVMGDLEVSIGELGRAETAYSKSIKLLSNNFSEVLKRATVRIMQDEFDLAQSDVDLLLKRVPNHPDVNYVQGQIHFHETKYAAAVASFDVTMLSENPNILTTYFLGAAHLRLANLKQAQRYAELFIEDIPGSVGGRKLLARIYASTGQYHRIPDLIEPILAANPDDIEALNLSSLAALNAENTSEGIEILQRLVILQPDSPQALLTLGLAMTETGMLHDGESLFEKAISIDPGFHQAYTALVENLLKQKAPEKAMTVAENYQKLYPESSKPYTLIGSVYLASGRRAEAQMALSKAVSLEPGDLRSNHLLASTMISQKQYGDARSYYENALKQHPNDLATLLQLAALDILENDQKRMVEHLELAVESHPQAIQPRIQLARYLTSVGKPEQALALMRGLDKEYKKNTAILLTVGWAELEQKKYAQAKETFNHWITLQPDSAEAHYLISMAYGGMKDWKNAKLELATTIALAPSYQLPRSAYARILLAEQDFDAFQEQLETLETVAPDHPETKRLQAELAMIQGDPSKAAALLEDVFTQDSSTENMLALVKQRRETGDKQGALELHKDWVNENPDDLAAAMALAGTYLQLDDADSAIKHYQNILTLNPNNALALNNLAWLLREKDPVNAKAYATKCTQVAPKFAEGWDTLAMILLDAGEAAEAKRKIETALAISPNYPGILYHSAMIDEVLGNIAGATATLTSLLDNEIDFPEKLEATELLARLTK